MANNSWLFIFPPHGIFVFTNNKVCACEALSDAVFSRRYIAKKKQNTFFTY